jgi:hypothetical protein
MNANKGIFSVNLGGMRDGIDRMAGWVDQLMSWARLTFSSIKPPRPIISFRTART